MIAVRGLGYRRGGRTLFEGLGFDAPVGTRLAVRGPSGSGKTTLLRLLAGLEAPDAGEVLLAGTVVSRAGEVLIPPHRRGIGFAFQAPLLWPHLSVGRNVGFGLRSRNGALRRVGELLERCGFAGSADRSVDELSGGEAGRVALARALAPRPRVLLLDEPFASVEPELRERLAALVVEEVGATGATLVYATHDDAVLARLGGAVVEIGGG